MNYRHSFHAGNFADVIKHAVLTRVLAYLAKKPAPFRVIDTHAGAGIYDLAGEEAGRTGEWREGIGRLLGAPLAPEAEALLADYRTVVEGLSPDHDRYPGSPLIIQSMLRAQDRASFNELHPPTFALLKQALGRDESLAVNALDGYLAWKAQIPPPERRGLVLVDPPFEATDEFDRMAAGAALMARKWPIGVGIFWYPVKNEGAVARFETQLATLPFKDVMVAELHVDAPHAEGPLAASGLALVNAPYTLEGELRVLLPALAARLGRGPGAGWRLERLRGH